MSLKVTFELTDKDLRGFRRIIRDARISAKDIEDDTIIAAASSLLNRVRQNKVSRFVGERLDKLDVMINMLTDDHWQIPSKERSRVVGALAYFAEEDDLVPDRIPALGFLDDAIIIELVVRELKHEIEAFEDFCLFRKQDAKRPKSERNAQRKSRLATKRSALHERMRRRVVRQRRSGGGPKTPLF